MSNLKIKSAAILAAAALAVSAAPAYAKVYNIVIGGVATPFDCPSSPLGETLTWVNQNCKQVTRAASGKVPLTMRTDKTGVVQPN
jgi:hypothetical protein